MKLYKLTSTLEYFPEPLNYGIYTSISSIYRAIKQIEKETGVPKESYNFTITEITVDEIPKIIDEFLRKKNMQ